MAANRLHGIVSKLHPRFVLATGRVRSGRSKGEEIREEVVKVKKAMRTARVKRLKRLWKNWNALCGGMWKCGCFLSEFSFRSFNAKRKLFLI